MSQETTPNGPEHEGATAEAKAPPVKAEPPSEPPTNIYVPPVSLPKSNVPAAQPDAKVVLNLPLDPVEHISEDQIRQARQRRRTATVKVDRATIDATTKVADLGIATKSTEEIADPETDSIDVDIEATPAIAKSYVVGAAAARAAADLAPPQPVQAKPTPPPPPTPARLARAEVPTPRAVPSPRTAPRPVAASPVSSAVPSIPPPRSGGRAWIAIVAVAVLGGGALLLLRAMDDDGVAGRPASTTAARTTTAPTTAPSAAVATTAATTAPSTTTTTTTATAEAPAAVATNAATPGHLPAGAGPRPPTTFPKATAPPRPPTAPGKVPKPKGGDIPSEI